MSEKLPKTKEPSTAAGSSPATPPLQKTPRRIPLWQALLLPLASILIFFLLLEGGLALFGVKPAVKTEDPFVGFASGAPLFVPSPGPRGSQWMVTAPDKLGYFNAQSFPQVKAPSTYRIFCMGASTTYGHPYDDKTSFAGWLRELLPAGDRSKNWEVINAGGISYASYRVAHLMEELIHYQPDLFIIYTGHNEFLEERTYREIRDMSPLVKNTVSVLNKTRTWSAMSGALQKLGLHPQKEEAERDTLGVRVDAILDLSAGLNRYTRDDALRDNILKHYRLSLERMVTLARSVGAEVIFVTPASSLKDCTPFKSEHTPGLGSAQIARSEEALKLANAAIRQGDWTGALKLLEPVVVLDPRHAELQYRYGQTLLALGRGGEAERAFTQARDEDVCPLRALTAMQQIVREVAKEQGTGLVDYVDMVADICQERKGHRIPGEELFLDHVHATIEGYKILALALIEAMTAGGAVHPGPDWGEAAIAAVTSRIESRIDREAQGNALNTLARVIQWAGKNEDAERLARTALETAGEFRQVAVDANSILATGYVRRGQLEEAIRVLRDALESAPGAIELRLKLGENLLIPQHLQLEEAAANFLLVCQQMPAYDRGFELYGNAMAKRGRLTVAYVSLMEALRLNPNNGYAKATLARVVQTMGSYTPNPQPAEIILSLYPSQAPFKLAQVRRDAAGRYVTDGIEVEFFENGRLKYFADIDQGKKNGFEMTWGADGRLLSRKAFHNDAPINLTPGS